jgi:hypothetical protein
VVLLAKDNSLKRVDLGLVHSSAAETPLSNIFNRLTADGDVEKGVSPNFLARNWPPAFKEWSTKAVRDAFYASPVFPRMLNAEAIKDTIARGAEAGLLAYVGKGPGGTYQPFTFKQSISPSDVEFSEDMFVIPADAAQTYAAKIASGGGKKDIPGGAETGGGSGPGITGPTAPPKTEPVTPPATQVAGIRWSGEVPPQKWMNYYTKVLSRYAGSAGLKLNIQIEVSPPGGVSKQSVEDTRNALRELGLNDQIEEK